MDLVHQPVAGQFVQSVDVLGDDAAQLPRLLQFKQLPVGGVGQGFRVQHIPPVEVEEGIRVQVEEGLAQDHLGSEPFIALMIKPLLRAEVRDAAGGGDARAAEEHQPPGAVHDFLKRVHADDPSFAEIITARARSGRAEGKTGRSVRPVVGRLDRGLMAGIDLL